MTGVSDDYEAVVYDLDGTILRLEVDWEACETEIAEVLAEVGRDPTDLNAWELLAAAETEGIGDRVESIIAEYERAGAGDATRLPLADELVAYDGPTGICSLNCEAACRRALDRHGLLEAVDVVVGRDSHSTRKPDPGPLLSVVEQLGVRPHRTLFVGDSASDRETARRAGTAFRPVPDGRTSRSE